MHGSARRCPAVREIPGRSDAEKALAASHGGSRHSFFAAALLADQASELLEQGEWQLADDALMACFLDLVSRVKTGDRIFRWTGSSLLVLMERHAPATEVQRELEQLSTNLRGQVFALSGHGSHAELSRRIDWYVATHLLTAAKTPA